MNTILKGSGAAAAADAAADAQVSNNFYRDGVSYDVRRIAYEAEAKRISDGVDRMRATGMSEENVARWAVDQRNNLKTTYRSISPPDFVEAVEARNLEKYGNKLGPSADQLRQKGLSWTEIANSAARTGGQDLGFGKQ
ncbi:hemagglutinin [Ralstonia pseudosolanacearum]|uniref:hemagglutinin n=1 Tax=Ralstonia pseudosolanacearum TaxID=1310165 RepID=UPI0012698112|nr:hemagglutinin [Ralstonia pseudosolanacearum]